MKKKEAANCILFVLRTESLIGYLFKFLFYFLFPDPEQDPE